MLDVTSTLHRLSVLVPAEGKYHQSCHSNYQIRRNKTYDLSVAQTRVSDCCCLNEDFLLICWKTFKETRLLENAYLFQMFICLTAESNISARPPASGAHSVEAAEVLYRQKATALIHIHAMHKLVSLILESLSHLHREKQQFMKILCKDFNARAFFPYSGNVIPFV